MIAVFHAKLYDTLKEINRNPRRKKVYRTNQGFSFFGGSFSNIENVRAQINFQEKGNLSMLIDYFLMKDRFLTSITSYYKV